MTSQLVALCVEADDPAGLAEFWAGVLRRDLSDDAELRIRFVASREPKVGPNQMHLDLRSASLEGQQETVARARRLGATHLDVGQRPEEGHVVLADPEGNEFCVVGPGNAFLGEGGLVGAVSSDGSRQVGRFWSAALGWPLVWDQDEETAIASPDGGWKISWGGPPLASRAGRSRLHLDLVVALPDGLPAETDRLVSLGASRLGPDADDVAAHGTGPGDVGRVRLADPDGNEFSLSLPTVPRRGDAL